MFGFVLFHFLLKYVLTFLSIVVITDQTGVAGLRTESGFQILRRNFHFRSQVILRIDDVNTG